MNRARDISSIRAKPNVLPFLYARPRRAPEISSTTRAFILSSAHFAIFSPSFDVLRVVSFSGQMTLVGWGREIFPGGGWSSTFSYLFL